MIVDDTSVGTRPDPDELLPPAVLDRWTRRVADVAGDQCAELFAAAMRRTLARTLHRLSDGSVFVITGDIPAMWLRDAATQMRPYVRLLAAEGPGELPALADVIGGVVRRQFSYIAHDPYANAFNAAPNGNCHEPRDLGDDPWLWERKYEIDSLCFPFQLAEQLADARGRTPISTERSTPRPPERSRRWPLSSIMRTPRRTGSSARTRSPRTPSRATGLVRRWR